MSLVFAAVIPNTPELALEMLQSNADEASKTYRSIKEVEGECYFMKPDTLVLLTEHGSQIPELINTNISNTLTGSWPENLIELQQMQKSFSGDLEFAAHLKEVIDVNKTEIPMTIVAESKLPPEVTAPLTMLLEHLPNTKVVQMTTAKISFRYHYDFGEFLRHESLKTNKRVAIIATGTLTKDSSLTPQAQSLDTLCLNFFKEQHPEKIININPEVYEASGSDLLNPLALLLGVLNKLSVNTEVHSYEKIYGSGHIVANFVIK